MCWEVVESWLYHLLCCVVSSGQGNTAPTPQQNLRYTTYSDLSMSVSPDLLSNLTIVAVGKVVLVIINTAFLVSDVQIILSHSDKQSKQTVNQHLMCLLLFPFQHYILFPN